MKIYLPIDFMVGDEFKEGTPASVVDKEMGIPDGKMVFCLIIINVSIMGVNF